MSLVVPLFSVTLFLSAFLLFTAEFIVAKAVLPSLGGVPMVWNTCMVFFQVTLLGGYLYAHGVTSWFGSRRHAALYLALLALPFAFLPFSTRVSETPSPEQNPIGWLIVLLLGWIGLPFFVLSTSATMLQKWFSTTRDAAARDPYFLYAASNLGSLLALISYPTLVEPRLRLADQSRAWAAGYAAFVVAAWVCAALALRSRVSAHRQRVTGPPSVDVVSRADSISGTRRARWVALAFLPSSLMLAVTSYLSTDIASAPLLWMVPLSLYLLTFVVAFGSRSQRVIAVVNRVLALLIVALALLMVVQLSLPLWLTVPLHLGVFTAGALLCHGQLAADRPPPSSLTEFYAWVSFGGMLGGVFNALAAPVLFSTIVEYPLVLVMACLFRERRDVEPGSAARAMDIVVPVVVGALAAGVIVLLQSRGVEPRLVLVAMAVPAFASFSQSRRRPIRFALSLGAMLLAGMWTGDGRARTLYTERTFFGVYRVAVDPSGQYRALFNGTTLHGMQAIDPARRNEPIAYYHRTGPFGEAMARLPNIDRATDVAVVGLGVGSLAAYTRPGQRWTFFELDPAVERLARNTGYFTYLNDCGSRCRVVIGDARISLGTTHQKFDLIVLDAFSSDAIPTHLLTSEAFTLYLSRLETGGVLALHVSNRHVSLAPVLARLADLHGLTAVERRDTAEGERQPLSAKTPSDWILMARMTDTLGPLLSDPKWVRPVASRSTPLWTDDSSSIVTVLRLN